MVMQIAANMIERTEKVYVRTENLRKRHRYRNKVRIGGTEARLPRRDSEPDDMLPKGSHTESSVTHLPTLTTMSYFHRRSKVYH